MHSLCSTDKANKEETTGKSGERKESTDQRTTEGFVGRRGSYAAPNLPSQI